MRFLLQLIKYLLIILAVFTAHVLVLNILPYPFNHTNIIIAAFLWLLLYNNSSKILWAVLPLSFLLELFVSFPFGVMSATFVFTAILVYWLMMNVFTNRTLYIVIISGALSVLIFRLFFIVILLISNIFNRGFAIYWPEFLVNILYEIMFTTLVFVIFYLAGILLFKRLNPRYITNNNIYGKRFV